VVVVLHAATEMVWPGQVSVLLSLPALDDGSTCLLSVQTHTHTHRVLWLAPTLLYPDPLPAVIAPIITWCLPIPALRH
jgi:hypothetical protein